MHVPTLVTSNMSFPSLQNISFLFPNFYDDIDRFDTSSNSQTSFVNGCHDDNKVLGGTGERNCGPHISHSSELLWSPADVHLSLSAPVLTAYFDFPPTVFTDVHNLCIIQKYNPP